MKKSTLLAAVAFSLSLPFSFAFAAEAPAGFSVEPAVSHISVAPGTSFRSSFSLRNIGKTSVTVTLRTVNFEPSSEVGGVHEIAIGSEQDDPIYAAGWVSYPKENIVIPAGRKLSVPYAVQVPPDASAGGRSIAFVVESASGSVRSRIYAPCFLSVPGDAKEELIVETFEFLPRVHTSPDGILRIVLRNNGKTHIRPNTEVVIRNMFGIERGRFYPKDTDAVGTIVPGAKRTIEYQWKGGMGIFDFGLWNARVNLSYGIDSTRSVADRVFFAVLPLFGLGWTIIILGGSIYLFVRATKKLRAEMAKLKEHKEGKYNFEKEASLQLLAIPFLAGLLLLVVVTATLFSVLSKHEEGTLRRDLPLAEDA